MTRLRSSDAAAIAALLGLALSLFGLIVSLFMALGRQAGWIGAIAGVFGLVFTTQAIATQNLSYAIPLFLVGLALSAVPFMGIRHRNRQRIERNQRLTETVRSIIKKHAPTLRLRRSQLVTTDHYGVLQTAKWDKELKRFFDQVLVPALGDSTIGQNLDALFAAVTNEIERAIAALPAPPATRPIPGVMKPGEFEEHCAALARACGWSARTVGGSGDQGIDVIAEKAGVKIVFQCKLYSKPVGNSAVQQIAAGKLFERATCAAVVSNQSYTPGARELAQAAKVQLLHTNQVQAYLQRIERIAAERRALAAA